MSRGSETDKSCKKKVHSRPLSRILERVRTRTQQEKQDLRQSETRWLSKCNARRSHKIRGHIEDRTMGKTTVPKADNADRIPYTPSGIVWSKGCRIKGKAIKRHLLPTPPRSGSRRYWGLPLPSKNLSTGGDHRERNPWSSQSYKQRQSPRARWAAK